MQVNTALTDYRFCSRHRRGKQHELREIIQVGDCDVSCSFSILWNKTAPHALKRCCLGFQRWLREVIEEPNAAKAAVLMC